MRNIINYSKQQQLPSTFINKKVAGEVDDQLEVITGGDTNYDENGGESVNTKVLADNGAGPAAQ